jgi:hypothetical protein
MTTVGRLLLSAGCLALLGAASPDRERRADTDAATPAAPAAAQPAPAAAVDAEKAVAPAAEAALPSGYVVYRDPATGQIAPAPPGVSATLGSRMVVDRPLFEETGRTGGVVVRLRGAFRNYMTVEVGKDGRLQTRCAQHGEADHVAH